MSTTTQTISIAQTILEQIQYADRSALWAWGATNFGAIGESKEWLSHQGWIKVCLRWVDDYTIVFMNKKLEVVKTTEGVFCDMLVPIIDWIEGK
jgi:hypothetical protein